MVNGSKIFARENLFNGFILFALALMLVPWPGETEQLNLTNILSQPSSSHLLGTDYLGRDLLARLRSGILNTVAWLWLFSTVGTLLGLVAGVTVLAFAPQSLGRLLGSFTLLASSIPAFLLLFGLAIVVEHFNLTILSISLSVLFFCQGYQLIQMLYLQDKSRGFWQAHKSLGGSLWQRLWQYGVRNHWRQRLVGHWIISLQTALVLESSLSYLGLGILEPQASFGNILSAHFSYYLKGDYRVLIATVGVLVVMHRLPVSLVALVRSVKKSQISAGK